MKQKLQLIGIVFIIVLVLTQPLTSLSQSTSSNSEIDKPYCFTEQQYQGILKLYTEYESCLEINIDLRNRLTQSQTVFEQLSEEFHNCINTVETTNEAYKEQVELTLFWKEEADKYKRQRNSWIVGGVGVSVGLSVLVLLLAQ